MERAAPGSRRGLRNARPVRPAARAAAPSRRAVSAKRTASEGWVSTLRTIARRCDIYADPGHAWNPVAERRESTHECVGAAAACRAGGGFGYIGAVTVLVGTSGWQYRDWRGSFYPPGLPQT